MNNLLETEETKQQKEFKYQMTKLNFDLWANNNNNNNNKRRKIEIQSVNEMEM